MEGMGTRMKFEARSGFVYQSGAQLVAQFYGTNAPVLAREYTALKNEIAAYQLLHQSVIQEYQRAMKVNSDPGVGAAAERMRVALEVERARVTQLEQALIRWSTADGTPAFTAADEALDELAKDLLRRIT